ncbi:MAG: acetyl-CoA C-acyltransferase, partial [Methanobacteriota archaeon]
METAVITAATRTPIGKFCGAFTNIPAPRLGAIVIREAVKRSGIAASDVDEVIMGNVIQAGLGQNPGRQAAIYAGIPVETPAYTVNKVCGSGLKAVMLAAQAVRCGDAEIVVAGGMENMTRGPYLLEGARLGYRLFDQCLVDGMVRDGLWDVYNNFHMGETGERIADKFNLTREEIDRFALRSHQRAVKATKEGKFKKEIVPVRVEKGKEAYVLDKDEGPREDTSLEKLSRLPPVFRKDGRITAGNASQISDGASALVVMSQSRAEELGVRPLATVVAYAS